MAAAWCVHSSSLCLNIIIIYTLCYWLLSNFLHFSEVSDYMIQLKFSHRQDHCTCLLLVTVIGWHRLKCPM
jgi:hypothetical protein